VKQCVNPIQEGWHGVVTAETCYDNYEDRAELVDQINSKFTELRSLYRDLKDNGDATGRRVYVIAYPQVVKVGGECGQNVLMNSDEVQFAHDMVAYLDNVIKRAADEAGVFYVDTQHAFDGHLLCEASTGEAAMNGFTISRKPDGGYDFRASFHPNQRGHQMLADTIAAQTANLTNPMPAPLPESSGPTLDTSAAILQNVPKLNRPLRYVRAIDDLAEKIVNPSTYVDIALNAKDYLTQANGVYNLVIHSDPVSLGNFTADAQGNVNVHAAVPDGTPPGFHTLHLYGNDMYGNPIDIQQVIFVTAPVTANGQSDMDGDGLPDVTDSCVLASQSGSDIDQDGIDDTCDPLISAAPTTPPGGTDGEPADIVWWDKAYVPITIHISSGR
jgi:hypothetical protein